MRWMIRTVKKRRGIRRPPLPGEMESEVSEFEDVNRKRNLLGGWTCRERIIRRSLT